MRLLPIVAVVAALALAPSVFAASTPTNKAACEKAKMKWDAKGGKDGKGTCLAAAPAAKK